MMGEPWLRAVLFIAIPLLACFASIISGFPFHKGTPLWFRILIVVVMGVWCAGAILCTGFLDASKYPRLDSLSWQFKLCGGFVGGLGIFGWLVIWAAIVRGARSIIKRINPRNEPSDPSDTP